MTVSYDQFSKIMDSTSTSSWYAVYITKPWNLKDEYLFLNCNIVIIIQ